MAYDSAPEMRSGVYDSAAAESYDYDYEEAVEEPMEAEAGSGFDSGDVSAEGNSGNAQENADPLKGRKLITTMNVSAETRTFDETLSKVEAKTSSLGGYIESSDIYNGNSYYDVYSGSSVSSRHASFTVRVPAPKLPEFLETVSENSNILSQSKNVEDITLSYVDTESRKNALKAEEKRLLAFMEEAESVEEMLQVESRLTDVRYELERIESQLRTYDNQVNFSTVYLDIKEVAVYTEPTPEQTVWDRIREGFADNLRNVEEWLVDLFVWFVVHIPQIAVFLVFVLIITVIVVTLDKRSRKKNIKRYELRKAKEAQEAQARAAKEAREAEEAQAAKEAQAAQNPDAESRTSGQEAGTK